MRKPCLRAGRGERGSRPHAAKQWYPRLGLHKGVQGAKTFPGSRVTPHQSLACVCVSPPALQGQPSHGSYFQLTSTELKHFAVSQVHFSFSK